MDRGKLPMMESLVGENRKADEVPADGYGFFKRPRNVIPANW